MPIRSALLAGLPVMTALAALAVPALLPASASAAMTCTATSGPSVPAVIELYTSEGCDSCPPADRWVSSLKDLAARGAVVPLAFHVDYWDYLGWKDPYADSAFSDRHRQRASESGAKVVYTPQVLYDNREFQSWRRTAAQKLSPDTTKPSRADLRINVANDGKSLALNVTGHARPGTRAGDAYVALFESGLSSDVKSGENRGVTLQHDFVVRQWLGPFPFKGGRLEITQGIVPASGMKLERSGIAIVARDDRGTTIQALALPLRDCAG